MTDINKTIYDVALYGAIGIGAIAIGSYLPAFRPAECLCEHHGAAYNFANPDVKWMQVGAEYDSYANGATIIHDAITITERCCITVNAAILGHDPLYHPDFEIERPPGTIQTKHEASIVTDAAVLTHHAAWEVLDPGTHDYYLINRSGATIDIFAAWLKIIASDCEG